MEISGMWFDTQGAGLSGVVGDLAVVLAPVAPTEAADPHDILLQLGQGHVDEAVWFIRFGSIGFRLLRVCAGLP